MNVLICDDNRDEANLLAKLLTDSGFRVHVEVFHSGFDTLDFIHTGAVIDICFLDIVMPEMSGIVLAEELRAAGFAGHIVFLSASKEYGPETYKVKAFDYLLKPLTPGDVREVLGREQRARVSADASSILVKSGGVTRVILHRNISHVEVIRHKVYFRLRDGGEIEVYATFAETAQELLRDPRFIQCHRSYLVNMQDIAEISESGIITRSGMRIPIPKSYRDTKNTFFKWRFGGRGT